MSSPRLFTTGSELTTSLADGFAHLAGVDPKVIYDRVRVLSFSEKGMRSRGPSKLLRLRWEKMESRWMWLPSFRS
jgi:hypothetical protein